MLCFACSTHVKGIMGKPSSDKAERGGFSSPEEQLAAQLQPLLDLAERKGLRALKGEQVLQLGALHRAIGTQLAKARAFRGSARSQAELNALFARSHNLLYGKSAASSSSLFDFVARFPAVVRKTWPFHLASLILFVLGALYGYLGTRADPEWGAQFFLPGDPRSPFSDRGTLLNVLLMGREGELGIGVKSFFASILWIHNTKVALVSFFSGLLLGIPTLYLIFSNGITLGAYTEVYVSHELGRSWFAWVLPHGVTELGAILLLSGAGLWIAWLLIFPGDRTRLGALRHESSSMLALALGAFPMLLVAGLLASFLRQSSASDSFRLGFAAVSFVLWLLFFLLVRPSQSRIRNRLQARSLAEKTIPLPEDEDLLAWLAPREKRV